jgi:hypothetical protein
MQEIKGYIWGVAIVVSMFSWIVTMFLVHMGLLVGIFLSLLAFFVRSLRCAALYVLLISLCGAVGAWGVFLGFMNVAGQHLEFEQIFQVMSVGLGASLTFGALVGAGLGFLLAKFLNRFLQRPTTPFTPPETAGASRIG